MLPATSERNALRLTMGSPPLVDHGPDRILSMPVEGRGSGMRIVDAQIHLWGSGLPSNMAHRQVTSFTTQDAVGLMDEGGVDAAVIHPPGWDPNSTEMAFKAVRDFPGRFAILGSFPLNQPDKPWSRSGGASRACWVCAMDFSR